MSLDDRPFDPRALHDWCLNGDEEAFDRLQEHWGARLDVNAPDAHGHTPAMLVLLHHDDPQAAWALLDRHDDLDWSVVRPDGRALVHLVAAQGTVDQMRFLSDQPLALDTPDGQGRTPLHLAALHGQAQTVEVLRTFGADPRRRDGRGQTPRDLAHQAGHPWAVRTLDRELSPDTVLAHVVGRLAPYPDEVNDQVGRALGDGADPDVSLDRLMVRWGLEDGSRALHAAVVRQDLGVVQRLLDAGANVNAPTATGATALMLAIPGEVGVVQALLTAGADPVVAPDGHLSAWERAETMARHHPEQQGLVAIAGLLNEARARWEQDALRTTLAPATSGEDVTPSMVRRRL